MHDVLVRAVNAVVFAVAGPRQGEPTLPQEPPDTWVLPDSEVRTQRLVIPDARRVFDRQQMIIYTQSIVIAALLVALFGALSVLRWH